MAAKLENNRSNKRLATSAKMSDTSLPKSQRPERARLRRWFYTVQTLLVVVLSLILPSPSHAADYGTCYDSLLDEYLACMPAAQKDMSSYKVTVEISPVTATCGNPPNEYQLLGDRTDTIDTCDASIDVLSHPPEYMIDTIDTDTWWQSVNQEPGNTELLINITFSFNKTYRLAGDIIFTFASARADKMVLEKSVDNGQTWEPLQYYARICDEFSGVMADTNIAFTADNPTAVICTNEYTETSSRATPGRKVEMDNDARFELLYGPSGTDLGSFYTALEEKDMLEFLQFTDLRVQLIEPATDGRDNYQMYYYGISDVQLVARCFCNLHAVKCNVTDTDVVCDCQHFTTGKNCESCLPLYNDRPWQRGSYLPFDTGTPNICALCECNNHADSCHYNETYGRGVCDDCKYNTHGYHCELCSPLYYPNLDLPLNDTERCIACDCEPLGVEGDNFECSQEQTASVVVGQCMCKTRVTGRRCDSCDPGYWGLINGTTPGTCLSCGCNLDGTQGQSNTCDQTTGQCPCKTSTTGQLCDICADSYYAFPTGSPERECLDCNCDPGGATTPTCDKVTGVCTCRNGITGDKCDRTIDGRYVPALDEFPLEPTAGVCPLTSDLYTSENPFDGTQMAECDLGGGTLTLTMSSIPGGMIQLGVEWPYFLAVRYSTESANITGTLFITPNGNTLVDLTPLSTRLGQTVAAGCPASSSDVTQLPVTFAPDTSSAVLTDPNNVTLDARCQYTLSLQLSSDSTTSTSTRRKRAIGDGPFITIDSALYLPTLSSEDGAVAFRVYTYADDPSDVREDYSRCLQQISSLTDRSLAMTTSPCNDLLLSVGAELYDGTLECACDEVGTVPGSSANTCEDLSGQCNCLTGVSGRQCDVCTPGYYNLTTEGCESCSCSSVGATSGACDYTTGQCPCLANIVLATDAGTISSGTPSSLGTPIVVDGTCSYCKPNFYGISQGQGCVDCGCNAQGSTSLQCDETGQCPCKDSVQGLKCDVCKDGFFGFGAEGCTACNCSEAGSLFSTCDQTTGVCDCKTNAQGDKCDECKSGFFNLAEYNPEGCQPCFCFGHGDTCTSASGYEVMAIQLISPSSPSDYTPLLGDQHISYGQTMTLWMTAAYILDLTGVVMLSLSGAGKTIQHRGKNDTGVVPTQTTIYTTRLLYQEWETIDGTGVIIPATSQDLLEVLANLTDVGHVTRVSGQEITVSLVSLTTAALAGEPGTAGEVATFVEECTCDPTANVGGLSCERCATGFRRETPQDTSSYSTCVACDCSGRGATDPPECDQITGTCLNCRNGTTGTNCELCSDNVIGDECDTCADEFWGLSQAGCSPCECSDPGSLSPVCDKESGQCSCADFVTGRTCNECEENYFNLTASGCEECDSCYGVVQQQIAPLRDLTADLADNVTFLQTNDVTLTLGPFNERLQTATTNTESLVQFLQTAQASESEILAAISGFNVTLDEVETGLTTLEMNTTADVEAALNRISSLLFTAQSYRTLMENAVVPAYNKIENLKTEVTSLSSLVSSLQSVEAQLQTLADSSSEDQAILAQLETLNTTVSTAAVQAEAVLANAEAAEAIHQTTVLGLLSLESRLLSLGTVATTTLNQAQALSTRGTDITSTQQRLQEALAGLQAFSVDYVTFNSRLTDAISVTTSLQSQITSESGTFSTTNVEALATVETAGGLANQTATITEQASHWLGRATTAEQTALRYQSEGNTLLQDAQNTLNVVQNFDELASDAQGRSASALEQVEQLTELSEQVINETESLTSVIVTLGETASQAKQASQQALEIISDKQQQLTSVAVESDGLSIRLSTLSDESVERYGYLDDARDNIVTPAQDECAGLNSDLATFQENLLATDTFITDTLQVTSNIQQRATALLARLRSLPSVATAVVVAENVNLAGQSLDVEDLRTTLTQLQQRQVDQNAELNRLTGLRDGLQTRLDDLRQLRDQILN